jgi:hypothetical protein
LNAQFGALQQRVTGARLAGPLRKQIEPGKHRGAKQQSSDALLMTSAINDMPERLTITAIAVWLDGIVPRTIPLSPQAQMAGELDRV